MGVVKPESGSQCKNLVSSISLRIQVPSSQAPQLYKYQQGNTLYSHSFKGFLQNQRDIFTG